MPQAHLPPHELEDVRVSERRDEPEEAESRAMARRPAELRRHIDVGGRHEVRAGQVHVVAARSAVLVALAVALDVAVGDAESEMLADLRAQFVDRAVAHAQGKVGEIFGALVEVLAQLAHHRLPERARLLALAGAIVNLGVLEGLGGGLNRMELGAGRSQGVFRAARGIVRAHNLQRPQNLVGEPPTEEDGTYPVIDMVQQDLRHLMGFEHRGSSLQLRLPSHRTHKPERTR
mmetsp:Transcript_98064/g.282883  ORF Transcript_98064/g.282883 Transcript_98064/m.282883 type:complete len:232 (-) Transcript_98064:236-931(-)